LMVNFVMLLLAKNLNNKPSHEASFSQRSKLHSRYSHLYKNIHKNKEF